MEGKNIVIAIALSLSVILFWEAFMTVPNKEVNKSYNTQNQKKSSGELKNQDIANEITPSVNQTKVSSVITREESINSSERIKIRNENLEGSLTLKGAIIDDISFKNYKKVLGEDKNVNFLNPKETENGYFIETGWTSLGNTVKVPNAESIWSIKGNNVLTEGKTIFLEWNNQEGLVFRKKIQLDDKFLFNISQEVENNSSKAVELFPYAQITRNKKPDDIQGFFILHEGFIGVFDSELKENDYDDIEDKKQIFEADSGWLGITDKYWMTALVPPKNENFKSTFIYKNSFKANYILNNPIKINKGNKQQSDVQLFVSAKEVETIDNYAENKKIEKFDLIIDWGWFYFFTKPLFFVIDYLFKITGNFGVAIVLITAAIRLIFFPLANYSFKSMAKMKALQPEMTRLKELYKDDKVKLQQQIMALYKKEQVNPASGCLPILIQIPFFFAIYKMLFISLEMRHQPFFGWIKDLSAQDPTSIFNLFGLIPWDPPGFLIIGIWPILMGLSMYLQQKLNPTPVDPIQAKIFMFFPLFLTIILAPFPSGLVVYWTINNILTIAQQWVIMRKTKVKTT
tara:strand:- start:96 stop:1805 length:1710 start_codon:yes stop_codon:yes gene_type:complete